MYLIKYGGAPLTSHLLIRLPQLLNSLPFCGLTGVDARNTHNSATCSYFSKHAFLVFKDTSSILIPGKTACVDPLHFIFRSKFSPILHRSVTADCTIFTHLFGPTPIVQNFWSFTFCFFPHPLTITIKYETAWWFISKLPRGSHRAPPPSTCCHADIAMLATNKVTFYYC